MSSLMLSAESAVKMKQCYDLKVKMLDFKGDDDTCVQIVRQWMPNHKNNPLLAALECIKAWQAKNPGKDDGLAIMGFMAAAYYLVEVAPPGHQGPKFTAHDSIMISALKHVSFGSGNQSTRFYADIQLSGVRTERQRWWLTSLVVRHRRQIGNTAAIATAERWLKDNPEPTVPAQAGTASSAAQTSEAAPAPPKNEPPPQPTLF